MLLFRHSVQPMQQYITGVTRSNDRNNWYDKIKKFCSFMAGKNIITNRINKNDRFRFYGIRIIQKMIQLT